MPIDDGYNCFRALIQELKRIGLNAEADAIRDAMLAGATGSECLGLLGIALKTLRAHHAALCKTSLKSFISPMDECGHRFPVTCAKHP